MSAVLLVIKDKKQVAKVAVSTTPFILGRGPHCNLVLDEPLASRQHAEILQESGRFFLRDMQSRNGTFLNGRRVMGRDLLNDGDEMAIGNTRLKFVWEVDSTGSEADKDATRVASPADLKKLTPSQQVARKGGGDFDVRLRVVEGPLRGEVFRNWEGHLTIGRAPDNTVPLLAEDSSVSAHHARIVAEGDGYFVEDLGSTNGTFLNNAKLRPGDRQPLKHGDKIRVGALKDGAVLVFEQVDLRRRRKTTRIVLISVAALFVLAVLVKLLQPPDVAAQNLEKALHFYAAGRLQEARDTCEMALKIDPDRTEAKRLLAKVKAAMEAQELLAQAEAAAAEENYDKAKELVYRVLRDFPKDPRAQELEKVVKSIEYAKVAITARNWTDAVRLLDKARESYPKSELLNTRLAHAQKEALAQQSLAKAREAFQHKQSDLAHGLLMTIATNSVYYPEARELLDKIQQERQVAAGIAKMEVLYREGHLLDALTTLAEAEKVGQSTTPVLAQWRDRLAKMEALAGPLAVAEALRPDDGVDALLQGRRTCDEILALESDPLNSFRRRALELSNRLTQWLQAAAQNYLAAAQDQLRGGNRKEAMRLLMLAARADTHNEAASQALTDVRRQIIADCRSLYQQGLVHEELGQPDLAAEKFKKVLEIGLPGEEYYEKATRKLK